jgi:PUB domain
MQWSKPGHLFLVSVILSNFEGERMLGGYRTIQALPSGCPHCVLVQEDYLSPGEQSFFFETILTDETKQDALCVAASFLDNRQHAKTVKTLLTTVRNVLDHPDVEKFQTLKLSNPRVKDQILPNQSAMDLLRTLGFHPLVYGNVQDRCLTLREKPLLDVFQSAKTILDLLKGRSDPNFFAELSAPVPWQARLLLNSTVGASNLQQGGTHFVTPEERWTLTKRGNQRRGRGRPSPGNAPSSRGKWGR